MQSDEMNPNDALMPPGGPQPPTAHNEHVRNIGLDLVWTVLSCGLFNVYLQHRQMLALNALLGETRYSFWKWYLFLLLTCGLYHVYFEYRKSQDLAELAKKEDDWMPVIAAAAALLGFSIFVDAVQQSQINDFFGSKKI